MYAQELKAERQAFRDAMQQTMMHEATPDAPAKSKGKIFGKKK
jgi:hypothetical protein